MHTKDFDRIMNKRFEKCSEVLAAKEGEYASHVDRLHNFKVAARILGTSPAQAALGMGVKHLVSIMDMLVDARKATDEALDEKITDWINYTVLIEACIREQRDAMQLQQAVNEGLIEKLKERVRTERTAETERTD